ncbi:hypothetical protein E2C01_036658 [Portunus trituberculatus]|uniref:Uncharacterized protein n=1 Tax=Portunus trituberculatus TaxID=210409 RepID=A0A5B7FEW8_PORTR|nr:hypothetical protein [Portunus trituberculatus]
MTQFCETVLNDDPVLFVAQRNTEISVGEVGCVTCVHLCDLSLVCDSGLLLAGLSLSGYGLGGCGWCHSHGVSIR